MLGGIHLVIKSEMCVVYYFFASLKVSQRNCIGNTAKGGGVGNTAKGGGGGGANVWSQSVCMSDCDSDGKTAGDEMGDPVKLLVFFYSHHFYTVLHMGTIYKY